MPRGVGLVVSCLSPACLLAGGERERDLDFDFERDRDLDLERDKELRWYSTGDLDLDFREARCLGRGEGERDEVLLYVELCSNFVFFAFCFALKNSNKPSCSHPSLSLGLSCDGGL